MEQFAAVRMKRRKPTFKNCHVEDDVYEEERVLHSFALKITYIGLDSKVEILEYLWGDKGAMNPNVLKDAEFEEVQAENEFKIPDEVMEHIKSRAKEEESKFHEELQRKREDMLEHLKKMAIEKKSEGKMEEARRIEEEIERRRNATLPDLRVKVEPVSLLKIIAPLEIHRTVLSNEFTKREVVWKFDNLTGKHDLKCAGCGKSSEEFYLTVDGLACADCEKECKVCGKPMINAHLCKECNAPLCEEHVHHCSVCNAPLCEEHATKCKFCTNEMCSEHVHHCSVCNAPLCEEHTYTCSVCGATIGPMHTRVCEVCGSNVCPDHIHKCEICGKNVCENCAVEIEGKWYCKEHLERGYGGIWVIPEIRCKECGVALSSEHAVYCEVCNAPLCPDHAHKCSVCGSFLCSEHTYECAVCHVELCDRHAHVSELSGNRYCESHSLKCPICGRTVGSDEMKGDVCISCANMTEITKKDVPPEIFRKFPYAKRGKAWYISRGNTIAYITEVKNMILSFRVIDGEILEHRSSGFKV